MSIKDEIYKIADEIFLSDPDHPLEKKLKLVSLKRVETAYHAQGKAPPSSRAISLNLKSWRHEKKSAPLENPQSAIPEIEEIPPPLLEELTMPEESSPHPEAYPQTTVTTTTTTTSLQEECPLVVPPAEMETKWVRLYSDVVCQQNKDIDSLKPENRAIASDLNALKSQYEALFNEKDSRIADLQGRVTFLRQELVAVRTSTKTTTTSATTQAEIDALRQQLNNSLAVIQRLEADLQNLSTSTTTTTESSSSTGREH